MGKNSFLLVDCNIVDVKEGAILKNASLRIKDGLIANFGEDVKPLKGEKLSLIHI